MAERPALVLELPRRPINFRTVNGQDAMCRALAPIFTKGFCRSLFNSSNTNWTEEISR